MNIPPDHEWPAGLRRAVTRHRGLSGKLDLLKVIDPHCVRWLLENWNTPDGRTVMRAMTRLSVDDFLASAEAGEFRSAPIE